MVGERLKDIREYYDNTQKEIANILNVSRSTYAGWENGIDTIPLLKLNDFCNHYNISLDYVCGLTNTKEYHIINTEINKVIVGSNLKTIRLDHHDTQATIADIIKTDQSNYSKYETGKNLIITSLLIGFSKHYNVSMDGICGKTKDLEIK